jgi:hypothetical protein
MRTSWTILPVLLCASCAPDVVARVPTHARDAQLAARPAGEPVIGRLKTRDRIVDLTVSAFAPGRDPLPREAVAMPVMADIDADARMRSAPGRDPLERAR